MQPVEALRRTIDRARGAGDGRSIDPDDIEEKKDQEALGICEAFFEAALPVARFQCMVTIEGIGPKS
jgi:hypothetical protein